MNRKAIRTFYSKMFKYSFPRGAVEIPTNSSVIRDTLQSSTEALQRKGWNIHLNMKDKRKTKNPVAYIDSSIDYRPHSGGVSLVVNIKDIRTDSYNTEVLSLSGMLQNFIEICYDIPPRGKDIDYLHEEE